MSQAAPFAFENLLGLADSYDQIQKMAIGGMAELYRGRQKNLDRAVAIKRIRAEYRDNPDLKERFRREARASAVLLHHNLGHVYDYREVQNEAYIIMEYIDGFDLSQILERVGAMPLDVALIIAGKILNGLAHVHAHGMIHRDLKPDNVRISTRGEVKIMDFGIALDPTESNLTMPGVLIGSPHYLSPEQILGAKLDARVDLFAFGITFYEMLTGRRPFFETDNESVYSRIQKGSYVAPESIRADLPPFFVQTLGSCLEVNPQKRPATANKVAAIVNEYLLRNYPTAHEARVKQFLMQVGLLSGNPQLIEIEERNYGGPERRQKKIDQSRATWLAGITFVLGLLLGAAGIFFYEMKQQEAELLEVAPAEETLKSPAKGPGSGRTLQKSKGPRSLNR